MPNNTQIVIDTLYCKDDIIVSKLNGCADTFPIVIEHTTKTGSGNEVLLVWIICGTIVAVSLIIAITHVILHRNKNFSLQKKYQRMALRYIKRQKSSYKADDNYVAKIDSYLQELE